MSLRQVPFFFGATAILVSSSCSKTGTDNATVGGESAPVVATPGSTAAATSTGATATVALPTATGTTPTPTGLNPVPTPTSQDPALAPAVSGATAMPTVSAVGMAPTGTASPQRLAMAGLVRGGIMGALLRGAHELQLTDAQVATLNTIEQQLRADDGPSATEFKAYQAALVAQVRTGKIDATMLAPLRTSFETAMQTRRGKDGDALNGLYAALTGQQRKSLTAAVRAKQAEFEANVSARNAAAPKPGDSDPAKRRLDMITKELGLDATQQKSVEGLIARAPQPTAAAITAQRQAFDRRVEAMLAAFEAEGFDAKRQDLWPVSNRAMTDTAAMHVQFLSQLLPILRPDQCETLASRMERYALPFMGRLGEAPDPVFGGSAFDPFRSVGEGQSTGQ